MIYDSTSSKAERLREYINTENVPELTPEEMELIETTGEETHQRAFVSSFRTCCAFVKVNRLLSNANEHPSDLKSDWGKRMKVFHYLKAQKMLEE